MLRDVHSLKCSCTRLARVWLSRKFNLNSFYLQHEFFSKLVNITVCSTYRYTLSQCARKVFSCKIAYLLAIDLLKHFVHSLIFFVFATFTNRNHFVCWANSIQMNLNVHWKVPLYLHILHVHTFLLLQTILLFYS